MKKYKTNIDQVSLIRTPSDVKKVKIQNSIHSNDYLIKLYNSNTIAYNESFIALYLNRANNTIAWQLVSQGGLTGTIADLQMIIKGALDCGASGIILSHNHPSGNNKPSTPDITLTKKITEAAKMFDISILDHVIVTRDDGYYSFSDNGLI
jgi:DNA repair protein RadC